MVIFNNKQSAYRYEDGSVSCQDPFLSVAEWASPISLPECVFIQQVSLFTSLTAMKLSVHLMVSKQDGMKTDLGGA